MIVTLVVTAVGLYAAVCLGALVLQRRMVYFPGRPGGPTPADAELTFHDVALTTADEVRLHGWMVDAPLPSGVVLVCHGNAGTVAERVPLAQAFVHMGWSCLLLDYRGYGRSEGTPSEEGTYRDAVAAYDHLTGVGFVPQNTVVFGESLGSGVAIELARRRPVAACIVESAFTSLPDVGARAYPWLPVRMLARIRYDNRAKIVALGVPVLVIHSPQDEVVPFAHGQALFATAREPKQLLVTSGRHNDGGLLLRADDLAAVEGFLQAALRRSPVTAS